MPVQPEPARKLKASEIAAMSIPEFNAYMDKTVESLVQSGVDRFEAVSMMSSFRAMGPKVWEGVPMSQPCEDCSDCECMDCDSKYR